MDVEAFAADLPRRFAGDVLAGHHVDRCFAAVIDRMPRLTRLARRIYLHGATGVRGGR